MLRVRPVKKGESSEFAEPDKGDHHRWLDRFSVTRFFRRVVSFFTCAAIGKGKTGHVNNQGAAE